ncbi:MAG: hypothetical protein RLZZ45_972 [Bacteroidota bacterium]
MTIGNILKFAWRYFRAKKSTNAINIISWVSVVAITFGTASLITIFSAFNGFESLVKSLYASFYPDIRVTPAKGKMLHISRDQLDALQKLKGIGSYSLVVEEKALLQNGALQSVVTIKGVDENFSNVSGIDSAIYHGNYQLGNEEKPGLVLGIGIEQALGLQADRSVYPLMIYLPRKGISLAADPTAALSSATIYPQGSFAIQSEFDNQYAITDLNFLKTYMSYADDEYSAIEIKLSEKSNGAELQDQLQSMLGAGFLVENRYEQNRTLYATIRLEKWAIYAIFTLILVVAAFNMIGALSMLVLEKQKDIQVLKAMGAADLLIQRIFLAEGILLGTLGAIAGMVLSLLVYFLQTRFKLVPLQGATFLIDHYPLKLMVSDFIIVATTVWIIAIAAAWFPAKKASQRTMDLRN